MAFYFGVEFINSIAEVTDWEIGHVCTDDELNKDERGAQAFVRNIS